MPLHSLKFVLVSLLSLLLMQRGMAQSVQSSSTAKQTKVLIVVTNHAKFPSRDDKTGLWLTELTHFYKPMKEAGIDVDIASPSGGVVPLDQRSLGWLYSDREATAYLADPAFMALLKSSKAASSIEPSEYSAVYFAGGHGAMWDFRGVGHLKRIAEAIYQRGGIVSSVCHGAAALIELQTEDGSPLIKGRKITGFSNTEETLSGLEDQVPYALQDALQTRGALYEKSWVPFKSFAIVDGRIVTGQNPWSTKAVATAVIQLLREQASKPLPAASSSSKQ